MKSSPLKFRKWWNRYLLIPFRDKGRDFEGADCLGLVKLLFGHYGIELPDWDISCFDTKAIGPAILGGLKMFKKIEEPIEPCLIIMAIDKKNPKVINHMGVYIGDGYFLHTIQKVGVSRTALDHPFYRTCIRGLYAFSPRTTKD